jgi:hypothetical protein
VADVGHRAFMALNTDAAANGDMGPDVPLGYGAVIDDTGGVRNAGGHVRSRKSMTVAALASRQQAASRPVRSDLSVK